MQTETTRRAPGAVLRSQAISRGSAQACSIQGLPGTTKVSISPSSSSQPWVAMISRPPAVLTGPASQGDDKRFIAELVVSTGELQRVVGVMKHVQGAAKVDDLDVGEGEEDDSTSPQRLLRRTKRFNAREIGQWQ